MSGITCKLIGEQGNKTWNEFVKSHNYGTFFHHYDWLKFCEYKSGYKLYPLALTKGGKWVAVFPVFVIKKYGIKIAASPPPKVSTPSIGPLVLNESSNQYKKEKTERDLINVLHTYLIDELKVNYMNIKTAPGLFDVRRYLWNSYTARPLFTYRISIQDLEVVHERFDGRIRTGIRKASQVDGIEYIHNADDFAESLIEKVGERYKVQGLRFPIEPEDISLLKTKEIGKYIHVSGLKRGEQMLMANILIKFGDTVHHWIGGIKPNVDVNGINELLHWNTIQHFSKEGYKYYELMGGNTEHLCDHKSKYNPELIQYYELRYAKGLGKLIEFIR